VVPSRSTDYWTFRSICETFKIVIYFPLPSFFFSLSFSLCLFLFFSFFLIKFRLIRSFVRPRSRRGTRRIHRDLIPTTIHAVPRVPLLLVGLEAQVFLQSVPLVVRVDGTRAWNARGRSMNTTRWYPDIADRYVSIARRNIHRVGHGCIFCTRALTEIPRELCTPRDRVETKYNRAG